MRFHFVNIEEEHTKPKAKGSIDGTEHKVESKYQQLDVRMRMEKDQD